MRAFDAMVGFPLHRALQIPLAGQRQHAVLDRHLHLVLIQPRQFGADHVILFRFLNVHHRRPRHRCLSLAAQHRGQPVMKQRVHLMDRIPNTQCVHALSFQAVFASTKPARHGRFGCLIQIEPQLWIQIMPVYIRFRAIHY